METKENNKLEEIDLDNEEEKEMAKRRRSTKELRAIHAKTKKPSLYKPKIYKPPIYKPPTYNPNKSFPKKLKIYVPKSSPTLSMKNVDLAIDKTFEKKKKKG